MKPLFLAALCALSVSALAQVSGTPARPLLRPRLAVGADGYSTGDLVKNLDVVRGNIHDILNYLETAPAPAGDEAAQAQKQMLAESAACAVLIAESDKALREGIPRGARIPAGAASMRKGAVVAGERSVRILQRETAADRASVAHELQALIELMARPLPEDTEAAQRALKEEADAEVLLKSRRAQLSVSDRRLARAFDTQARKDAGAAGQKALKAVAVTGF